MMTEDQQPVWVESDGVSNLPTEVGIYKMRNLASGKNTLCFFNGKHFCKYVYSEREAELPENTDNRTRGFSDGIFDAWWDYQGLMAKPQVKIYEIMPAADGRIYSDPAMTAKVNALHACGTNSLNGNQWHGVKQDESIMTSDEPGIVAMAERTKPAPEPEKVVVGGLTIDMADLVEFLKAKQPKPEPNNTPRGILTMWNEGADHRLGAFQQTGNFAD